MAADDMARQETFFKLVFGPIAKGFLCIAIMGPDQRGMKEEFYQYPNDLQGALDSISLHTPAYNVYFCPQLLSVKRRLKENVLACTVAWADLDECLPKYLHIPPTITIESSPGRYQALWSFEEGQDPISAEEISRRIAYEHAKQGADKSGWDLTQLLRVPGSYNFKYANETTVPPIVEIVNVTRAMYRPSDFEEKYQKVPGLEFLDLPMPKDMPRESPDEILQRYRRGLNPLVWKLYGVEPEGDSWSEALWQLEMLLVERGMTREEVFVVAQAAKCNKYARDGKKSSYLWKEVGRAFAQDDAHGRLIDPTKVEVKPLLTNAEAEDVERNPTFVERYIKWASGLGDAAKQYHQAGAFTALSSLLAGNVRLPTSFGTVLLNLWFMILADTTLTRKSTAMDIAMDLIMDIDSDVVLATDGSLEGLMTALATRPGQPGIFLRDEFSGLIESMTKKDYMAGMAEMLTKLYDGKMQKRILRKETIEVRDPVLILFTGGIRDRITSLLTLENVSSGFIPRFVFVTAESDPNAVRPLGPPTVRDLGERDDVLVELQAIYRHYHVTHKIEVKTTGIMIDAAKRWNAKLTPQAWGRYNQLETAMVKAGINSHLPDILTPTYDRLAKSTLKAAVLIAASRSREEELLVEEEDIIHAIYYAENWRNYAHEVIENVGKGTYERELEKILSAISKRNGTPRSMLMTTYHLTARRCSEVLDTLEQRGQIVRQRAGRSETIFAARS